MLIYFNSFVTYYPLIMSVVWITGSLLNRYLAKQTIEKVTEKPMISIFVPAYNESDTIAETVAGLVELTYENYEIILINDKSQDDTVSKMYQLKRQYTQEKIRILNLKVNGGKARALNTALKKTNSNYILVIDSDSYIQSDALEYLVKTILSDKKIGAVTGRPIVRNRTTLLGRVQTLEYTSIIANIKEAQSFFMNQIMTLSGVISFYRTEAVESSGGWDEAAMTEDIDATWKLYQQGWKIKYEPKAICWILVPKTIRGLIKQRTRWSVGGLEVLVKNRKILWNGDVGERLLLTEMIISHLWSWCFLIASAEYFFMTFRTGAIKMNGLILCIYMVIGLIQFLIGIISNRKSAGLIMSDNLLIPIYLIFYWLLNLYTAIAAELTYLFSKQTDGRWESPDRGIK
ncbi:glycosyltransferase [Dellaglioa sp. L3N]